MSFCGIIYSISKFRKEKPMADPAQNLTSRELFSIIATGVIGVVLAFVAWFSYHYQWLFVLAFSVGGIGGLVHDVAQSRGKILFFERHSDGLYLGTIAGVFLGAVAGILVIRGYLTEDTATTNATFIKMSYEAFLAGLALKGVAEAAGTGATQ
jgi:hypothetical protein